jgi:hypothetical protein
MAWSEIIDRTIHAITQLAPTIGVVATGWLGLQASKAGNLNKEQFNELKTELNTIHVIGEDNKKKIIEIDNKLAVHDEAHLTTMYLRLERDITTALERGYTTVHESDIIHKMHKSYKNLGGNGYIDSLYQKYNILEVRN